MTKEPRTTAGPSAGAAGSDPRGDSEAGAERARRADFGPRGDSEAGEERARRADSARRRRTAADPAADYWQRLRSAGNEPAEGERPRPDEAGRGGVDDPGMPRDFGGREAAGGGEGAAGDWERIRDARWFGGEAPGASGPERAPSLSSLLMLLEGVRSLLPRELEQQFNALLREVLLTLRALIDWYLERLDGGHREQRVEDIPIE